MDEKKRESNKVRRLLYRRKGWCIQCGRQDERTMSGKTCCKACEEKKRMYKNKSRERRRKEGLCIACGGQSRPGYDLCEACALKNAEKLRDRYYRLKSEGICVMCGKAPASPGLTKCKKCRLREREYRV